MSLGSPARLVYRHRVQRPHPYHAEARDASLVGEAGLDPSPGPYRTRVPPGGSFETPTIFIGAFRGGPDGAGNIAASLDTSSAQQPAHAG